MGEPVRLASLQELMAVAEGDTKVVKGLSWAGNVSLPDVLSGVYHVLLTGNVVLSLPLPASTTAFTVTLELTQDATGGRTLTVPGVVAAYGVPPMLSTAANALDELHLMWDGVRWKVRVAGLSDAIPTSWVV